MSKHTPGPWRVEMEDDTPVIWAHPNEHDISVCEIGWEPIPDQARPMRDNGTAIGNALLIAAAPDMADALKGMLSCGRNCGADVAPGECCHHVAAAIAALTKAGLGES